MLLTSALLLTPAALLLTSAALLLITIASLVLASPRRIDSGVPAKFLNLSGYNLG